MPRSMSRPSKAVSRPKKSMAAHRKRTNQHKKRLVALGVPEEDLRTMSAKEIRTLLKKPARIRPAKKSSKK